MKKFYIILYCITIALSKLAAQPVLIAESFEGGSLPASWSFINTPATGVGWAATMNAYQGSKAIRVYSNTYSAVNAWAFTPAIPLNNTYLCSVTLFVRKEYTDLPFKITIGNSNTIASQSITLVDTVITNDNYSKLSFAFIPQVSDTYYFGFNSSFGVIPGSKALYMDSVSIRQNQIQCMESPEGGNTVSDATVVCMSSPFILSVVNGTSGVTGLTYQWQSSTDNINWTSLPGEINNNYRNLIGIKSSTYYRRKITCGSQESFSSSFLVSVNSQPDYALLPFAEGFEAVWQSLCNSSRGLPSNNWRNEPLTGNNSWRRDDEGNYAGWDNVVKGWNQYGANRTSRSARFHNAVTPKNSEGNLSLYLNCSAGFSSKELTFYCYLGDSLTIQLSIDGGLHFTALDSLGGISSPSWELHKVGFYSSSETTVIRFRTKTTMLTNYDIQLDEVSVVSVPCFTPLGIVIKPLVYGADYSIIPSKTANPSAYEHAVTTSSVPPAPPSRTYFNSNTTDTIADLEPSTTYFFHFRSVCTGAGNSPWLSQSFKTAGLNCAPLYANRCSLYNDASFYIIRDFMLKGENGTMIHQSNITCPDSNYYDFTAVSNVTLAKGKSYNCNIYTDSISNFTIWIDFNNDGAFTYKEKLVDKFESAYSRGSNLISLYIPENAKTGRHRLRIRQDAQDPCEPSELTPAQDYTVTIAEANTGATYNVSTGLANNCIAGGNLTINEASNNNIAWVPLIDMDNNVIAAINSNGNDLNRINVSEYINNGSIRTTLDNKRYLDRNVQISVETQPKTSVGIRIYILQSEFDALKAADPSIQSRNDLWMTKTAQSCGSSLGAGLLLQPVNSGDVTNGFFVEYNISGFSSFYFNNNSGALPVTLKNFNAVKKGIANRISWTTAAEFNNVGFEIQRSDDGADFTKLSFVESKAVNGISSSSLVYFFDDINYGNRDTYYRLRQIDKDGHINYSTTAIVKNGATKALRLSIFPNPVEDLLTLGLFSATSDRISISIRGILTNVLINKEQQINKAGNKIKVNVSSLPAGTYFIKVVSKTTGEQVISKFLKL